MLKRIRRIKSRAIHKIYKCIIAIPALTINIRPCDQVKPKYKCIVHHISDYDHLHIVIGDCVICGYHESTILLQDRHSNGRLRICSLCGSKIVIAKRNQHHSMLVAYMYICEYISDANQEIEIARLIGKMMAQFGTLLICRK